MMTLLATLIVVIGLAGLLIALFIVKTLKEWEGARRSILDHIKDHDRKERERELATYAQSKKRKYPLPIKITQDDSDDLIHTDNPKAEKILIPANLDAMDKALVKEFFNL